MCGFLCADSDGIYVGGDGMRTRCGPARVVAVTRAP